MSQQKNGLESGGADLSQRHPLWFSFTCDCGVFFFNSAEWLSMILKRLTLNTHALSISSSRIHEKTLPHKAKNNARDDKSQLQKHLIYFHDYRCAPKLLYREN